MKNQLVSNILNKNMMFRRTIFYFSITIVFSIASLTYFILTEKQNVFKLEEFPGSLVEDHNREKEDHFLCVLVPFRDRFEELLEFVPSISRFLSKISSFFKPTQKIKVPI